MATNAAKNWPIGVLKPREISVVLDSKSLSGGQSVSGISLPVAQDSGIWKVKYSGIALVTDLHVLTFRAIEAYCDGRLNRLLVPFYNRFAPWPAGTDENSIGVTSTFDDGATFDDGSAFVNRVIDVNLNAAAARGATSITVDVLNASEILPGMYFSSEGRAYIVRTVTYTAADEATIDFRPPLRVALPDGAPLNFDNPECLMRLKMDGEMQASLLIGRFGFPDVEFIESIS